MAGSSSRSFGVICYNDSTEAVGIDKEVEMIEELIASVIAWGFSREILVVIISALPIVELRGALPLAIKLFHLPWYQALGLAIIGNMLPVPLLLLFFESLTKIVSRTSTGKRLVDWTIMRARRNAGVIEKYENIGLMLFVAIPLPVTGAWTGSIVAFLGGLKFKRALFSIAIGVVISGAIVTALTLMGWVGAVIAGLGLVALAALGLWKV